MPSNFDSWKPLSDHDGLQSSGSLHSGKKSGVVTHSPVELIGDHGNATQFNKPKKRLTLMALRVVLLTGIAAGIMAGVFGYYWLDTLGVFDIKDSEFSPLVNHRPSDNTIVYDRKGEKIGEFFSSYHVFTPYEKLPKFLVEAIVAIEDRNYFEHAGYDPKAMLRALWVHLKGRRYGQGASTITQQLVRNFLLTRDKTINRKVKEIAYSARLEELMNKERIMEIYANSLFLGHGSYGVGAAAYRYFGKELKDLKRHEAALIAGLFQSPSRYNPHKNPKLAKARQLQVLKAMLGAGFIKRKQYNRLAKLKLRYQEYEPLNSQVAPHFLDHIKEEAESILISKGKTIKNKGLRIYTTLDANLQKLAEESIKSENAMLEELQSRAAFLHPNRKRKDNKRARVEAAVLTLDPRSGEILTMVGGRDYQQSQYNRVTSALRSPGSAFKPIVFSLALEKQKKWSDVIFVSPVTINNYRPHTPNEDFLTETTLLRAFYRSMNTPTIELGQELGLMPVIEHAKRLGVRTPLKEEFGTMLGGSDVNMMDMARLYTSYANGGVLTEPVSILKIEDRNGNILHETTPAKARQTRVMSQQIAFLMTQGMQNVLARGTGYQSAALASKAAGKTGTSNNATDNWFCGYTPDHVAIVWVGTDEHKPIYGNITGANTALPIWDKYMRGYFSANKPKFFSRPPGVVSMTVHSQYGHRSDDGVRMWFLRGQSAPTEPSALEALSQTPGENYRDVFVK